MHVPRTYSLARDAPAHQLSLFCLLYGFEVKRTTVRRSYRRKKTRKKKLRPMTQGEEELALLEPLEFASKQPPLLSRCCCCGSVAYTEIAGPGAAASRLFRMSDAQLRGCKKCFDSIGDGQRDT
jgi:hypothetical protein